MDGKRFSCASYMSYSRRIQKKVWSEALRASNSRTALSVLLPLRDEAARDGRKEQGVWHTSA
jgi:hypothetical protein